MTELQAHPFDTEAAYALYRRLVAPAGPWLQGVRHLLVVADGPLQSLPLSVLVTAPPPAAQGGFSHYRRTAWLADQYALSTLPSVSSLRLLRRMAGRARGSKPLIGFGDPQLGGAGGPGAVQSVAVRGLGGIVAETQLPPLPETAAELRAIARAVGADEASLYLGERATKAQVQRAPLADYRLVAFATHALVAGDLPQVTEPALVLSRTPAAAAGDDWLLTASEVAQLRLDADWVILSACNTAAADGTLGAEALSGLARAFFYAGSRALLVSHWPVFTDAAIGLTTATFETMAVQGLGRAAALGQAMAALRNDPARPHYAHPAFWAAFVVVGEGGGALPPATAPAPARPYVTAHAVSVRTAPDTHSAQLTVLPAGTAVEVLETVKNGTWARIARHGQELGFVFAPLLEPADR